MVCAVIHDVFRDTGGAIVAGWLWWTPVLCVLACLAVLPGTPGPNRYGFGSQKDRQAATSVGDAPRST
jgi:hypothetical protein